MYPTAQNLTAQNPTSKSQISASRRIAQLENHPAMPALLRELPPRAVASLFQTIGVSDATVLMAMMPTRALLLTFDESIWKSARPGMSETISVGDLIEWLEAWSEIGEQFLVEKLDAMGEDYLITMLARIVTVESISRYAVYGEVHEKLVDLDTDNRERFGPYIIEPSVDGEDVVRNLVRALWISDPQKFIRVFGRMSDLPNPDDSTRGSTPTLHDIESERESFREARGFVTADGARGFFAYADALTVSQCLALDSYDVETRRHLDALVRSSESSDEVPSPVVADDHEDNQEDEHENDQSNLERINSVGLLAGQQDVEALCVLLEESQLLPKQNTVLLLQGPQHAKELALTDGLRRLADENIESFHSRARELAYLANVLQWLPTGADALTDDESKSAAFAICNLGLEFAAGTRADEIENEPGLIRLFLLGWNALSSLRARVVGAFAGALSKNLNLPPWLKSEATVGLADLRQAVEYKRFPEAREATIFLSIVFDSRVCHAIAPLLDAIPRFSALLGSGEDFSDCRWIATKEDIKVLERLLDSVRAKHR